MIALSVSVTKGVMVWGGISSKGKTDLVIIRGNLNALRYRDEILNAHMLPCLQQHQHVTSQQDNVPPHTARITQAFLRANNINALPWPAMSPDLSPIEHIWDEFGRRVHSRDPEPLNVYQLEAALIEEWDNMPMNVITSCIYSMRRRCDAVIASQVGHTAY